MQFWKVIIAQNIILYIYCCKKKLTIEKNQLARHIKWGAYRKGVYKVAPDAYK